MAALLTGRCSVTDAIRATVCLTFDFDAISIWIGPMGAKSPSMISRGEFGAVAARRILKLLEREQIHATFFTTGHTAETYPEVVREIVIRRVALADFGDPLGKRRGRHDDRRRFGAGENALLDGVLPGGDFEQPVALGWRERFRGFLEQLPGKFQF